MATETPQTQNYWQQDDVPETPAASPVAAPTASPVPDTAASQLPMAEPSASPDETNTPDQTPEGLPQPVESPDNPPITWTAQEYVHLDKSPVWFILFAIIVLGLVAVDVFFLKSWTFSALVIVMAIAVIIYIRRPPRMLTYALSPLQGLYVGEKLYTFDEFKAFGLIQDGDHYSIMLIPRKRFAAGVSVYFPEDAGERIVDILGQQLPMENLKLDVVDIIVRKLRL
ncbi:MAG TPA: hypothetical protein VN081_02050 [Dongiaceae bacterium]|nr:hypothetical protein [Dongiaceae bacterium]